MVCADWWKINEFPLVGDAQVAKAGYPPHRENRENRENGQINSLSGKTQGIWKVCQNTGKTRGIWLAQVVNSLILKVKNISIFATKISIFFF